MAALKDVYEIVFDIAKKANLPTEVAKLRCKLEQLEEEHVRRQIEQLKQKIKGLEEIVKGSSPTLSSEKTRPVTANERVDKDDLSLDAQGW